MIPELSTLLSPLSVSEFMSQYRGNSYVYSRGTPSRYLSLFDSNDLECVLSRLVTLPGMFRAQRPEGVIPIDQITVPTGTANRRLVNAQALQEQLEKGATLTLENCESHFQGLYAMSSMLAKAFAARVYASLFVVYKPELPLGLHWDDRDQFICQIVGHKQWPVYKPVYPNPLFDSRRFSYKVPPSDLVEEITLGPGDALYLPRGWLHDPAAVEGPSVHIAFAIITPTAYDLLEWIRSELKTRYPEIRADLPLSLPASARATYAARLRELIMNSLTDESIEAHYERHTREIQPTRVSLRPFSAGNSATLQHCGANHTIVPGRESA